MSFFNDLLGNAGQSFNNAYQQTWGLTNTQFNQQQMNYYSEQLKEQQDYMNNHFAHNNDIIIRDLKTLCEKHEGVKEQYEKLLVMVALCKE